MVAEASGWGLVRGWLGGALLLVVVVGVAGKGKGQ